MDYMGFWVSQLSLKNYIFNMTSFKKGSRIITWWWWQVAKSERISRVSWSAGTRGQMVYDLAISILTARSRTRVLTFVSDASSVRRTIRVEDTLRSTSFVRIAYVIR